LAEADRQIAAEDKAARDRRVRERAMRLQGEARRVDAGHALGLSTGSAAQRWKLDELVAEWTRLLGPVPPKRDLYLPTTFTPVPVLARSAADDERLQLLETQIYQLVEACHKNGTLPPNVRAKDLPLPKEKEAAA